MLVAAGSQAEKDKWVEDLQSAITSAKDRGDGDKIQYPSLKSNSKSPILIHVSLWLVTLQIPLVSDLSKIVYLYSRFL